MCGIVGYIGKNKKALDVLIKGLENLEYRGYDSSGVAYVFNNELELIKEEGKVQNLKDKLNFNKKTNIGIAHTRWATHGKITKENSHPHKCGRITIVHNGIIENYIELKKELQDKGYIFKSETDTEVACAMLDYFYNKYNDVSLTIKEFQSKVKGAYAIGMIIDNDYDNLYAIKKASPLIIGVGDNENYIASDVPAIVEYTKKYIILEDGDFAKITSNNIEVYDKNNEKKEIEVKNFEGNAESISKCGYEHYLIKEINEQPDVIKNTANAYTQNNFANMPDFSKYKKITIVACGSAMHAGLIGKNLIEKYGNIPVDVEIASEFRYKKLFLDKDTLVIAISQSGETADTLEAVKIAKEKGCDTLGIINAFGSSIARNVDEDKVLYTKAKKEISVATTKAYSAQCEILSFIAYILAKNCNDTKDLKEISNFLSDLNKLPIIMQEVIGNESEYKNIAKNIYTQNDIFYIGRGIDYALCMEGSLKLKEISYLHSEAYAAGELKHGTISLIEDGTPVVGIITDENIAEKTISNLKEVKTRGANVIYLTTDKLDKDGDFYDTKIVIPKVNPLLQPLVAVIPLQLIAYHVAKFNNCDIDKPKNLAKSVTVE